jgi:hypothetical protein
LVARGCFRLVEGAVVVLRCRLKAITSCSIASGSVNAVIWSVTHRGVNTYGYKGAFLRGKNYLPVTNVDEGSSDESDQRH